LPRQHGIVANSRYEPSDAGRNLPLVTDANERLIGPVDATRATGKSPRQFLGSTLPDELKLADPRSRVFSVSLKDRAAIFLAGKRADGAFWWERSTGGFVSSTYYGDLLPEYVQQFNAPRPADRYAGKAWEQLLPEDACIGVRPVKAEWSERLRAFGERFPHRLPDAVNRDYYSLLSATPFGNELVLDLARHILLNEGLGTGPATDMLCISLSSNDYAGHVFGPDSAEVIDITLRTDRQLADLFDLLHERLGLENGLIALTGDHGVTTSPFVSNELGLEVGFVDEDAVVQDLNRALRDALGSRATDSPLIIGFSLPFIYCDASFHRLDDELGGKLTDVVLGRLRKVDGIEAAFSAEELSGDSPGPEDKQRYLAWRSFNPRRAGSFYVRLLPLWNTKGRDIAGHSAGFQTDRHVPILLYGRGVQPGRHTRPADPLDIAVTLAKLLDIKPPPGACGHILQEAVKSATP
jgi:hypothetical protein